MFLKQSCKEVHYFSYVHFEMCTAVTGAFSTANPLALFVCSDWFRFARARF